MYLFSLIVYASCFLNMGLVVYVLIYYIPVDRKNIKDGMRWHTIFVSFSYLMLEIAAMIGFAMLHGVLFGIWILVSVIVGTVSLVLVFREAVQKRTGNKYKTRIGKYNEKENIK